MDIEKLSTKQLQAELKKLAKPLQADFAPLLYHLREKMKTPGKAGGWGFWVRKHLPFSLKTATNWANEYGVEHRLMEVKQRATSGKSARGSQPDVFQFVVPRPKWLPKQQAKELQRVIRSAFANQEAFQIFFDAVMKAAHGKALSAHA
jgi:hypothetical protein